MDIQTDRTGHQVRIHIDQHSYESPTPTTGDALYQLASIGPELVLFKEVEGNREDTPVPKEGTYIHLKEDDHFHSARPSQSGVEIFVNTDPFRWERPKITYEEVVRLAYSDGPHGGNVRYNVMWTRPDGQEGALRPDQSVGVVNEMTFDVRNTDKS
jgi:Multiubiquitin